MKKGIKVALTGALVLGVGYMAGVGFYAEKFMPNTSFTSVNISNLTLDEAQAKIESDISSREIVLEEGGQEVGRVTVGDLAPEYKTQSALKATYLAQNPANWLGNIVQAESAEATLADQVDIDEAKLAEDLSAQGITNEGREAARNAEILYSEEDGYYVEEAESGNAIDYDRLGDAIFDSIQANDDSVALEDAYDEPTVYANSEEVTGLLQEIEDTKQTEVTLQFEDEDITIPSETIEEWIHFADNNDIVIDRSQVIAYLETINEDVSTFGKTRQFESTMQGTVEVPPGILGWGIDTEAEAENIASALEKGETLVHEPAIYSTGNVGSTTDEIGDTYIEIDLTYQTMWLYYEGQLIVETPIVSGKMGAETVPGANAVNEMLTNTNLVGFNQFYNVNYSTPVSYWIRFDDQAQGIHDASWQGAFGGDVWVNSGSLGCINTPLGAVATIYEYVEIGTPVMVFH